MTGLRVAVIGGGIFGVTAAIELARDGHDVELRERNDDLLMGASGINQYRLHRGYHYPRSIETAMSCMDAESTFREEYGAAVIDNNEHYYAISARDSLTSASSFIEFCDVLGLEYTNANLEVLRNEALALTVRVRESALDPQILRAICWEKLDEAGVHVSLSTTADQTTFSRYDFTVLAVYSSLNELLEWAPRNSAALQFEVCEKPVVRLPSPYQGKGIVILDGPFMCVDPFGRTGTFVLGNVVHAIHHTNVGTAPEIPDTLRPLLNRGVIAQPPVTKFDLFIDSAKEFFVGIEDAEHVGSMFTVRTVLPDTDITDARPTIIDHVTDRILSIYSGKIGTCVQAAREITDVLRVAAPR